MGVRSVITREPPNVGVDTSLLDGDSLSQRQMFLRCNFPPPTRLPDGFDVVVPGSPQRRITLDMMASQPQVEIDLVLECAGNGRKLMSPVPDGTPWSLDAVSPISVAGVHLADVLGPLPDDITSVVFTGADEGTIPMEGRIPYQFSIDAALARTEHPILVTRIGREPLTRDHGAPVRLIVPGHYGMKSVKWLTRIEALTDRFQGHFVRKYRFYGDAIETEGAPVGEIAVRSVISYPGEGSLVGSGAVEILGSAWTGGGDIARVEVSTNGGETWEDAELVRTQTGGRWAPVHWTVAVELAPGTHEIMCRATDSTGATQPMEPRWNANGYANNVVQRLTVEVT